MGCVILGIKKADDHMAVIRFLTEDTIVACHTTAT